MSPPSSSRSAWPRSARSPISARIVESGQYFVRPGPSSCSHAPGRGRLRVLARVRVAVEVGEHDRARGDAERAEPLDEREPHRPVLGVHAERRARPPVRGGARLERPRLERRHDVVARAELDHPAPDPVAGHVAGEPLREPVGRLGAQRVVRAVVRVAVQSRSPRRRAARSRPRRARVRRGRARGRSASSRRVRARPPPRASAPPRPRGRGRRTRPRAARACRGRDARARRTAPAPPERCRRAPSGRSSPPRVRTLAARRRRKTERRSAP